MPLRPIRPLLTALAALLSGVAGANDLNWLTAEDVARLPQSQQQDVPVWCGGIYYNPALADIDPGGDTVITADQSRLTPGGEAELSGQVLIEQPGRILRAEQALFNQESGDFRLSGDIHVELPDATFNAADMTGNSRDRQAQLENVEYAIFPLHGRGNADRIEQADQLIRISKGSYTTCEPGSNGWRLEAGKIELDRDKGWGTARNVLLKVEGIPVAWIPWLTFPIDDRRKTGLLFPSINSSDAGGIDITQPLYLNLHPQLDATLAPRHIHGRGNGLETEVRYLTDIGEGAISHAWLRRDRLFGDRERELARWQHLGAAGPWQLSSDVNYVSDDFYFTDLDTGLEVSARTHLPRTGAARYLDQDWQVLIRAQSWQTIDPNLAESDYPYRRLPQFQAVGNPSLAGPLELLWLSDFTRFDRGVDLAGGDVTGKRTHLEPGLSLPLRADWGYLEPRLRLYHTRYQLKGTDNPADPQPERTLAGGSLDAGLFLERPFEVGDEGWRQTLEPRLFANRIEHQDQDQLPDFDAGELSFSWQQLFRENRFSGFDRIGDEKSLSVGLTSRFIRDEDGREVLRLRTGQQFYDAPRRVQLDGAGPDTSEESPLLVSARLSMNEHWALLGATHWNTDENRKQLVRGALDYRGKRRFFRAGYQERRDVINEVRQSELAGLWPVHDNWSLLGRWLYDLDNRRSLETMAGVQYRDCCWMIRLVNHRQLSDGDGDADLETDRTLLLQIQLVGLGGFGGRVDSLLEQSLPGYQAP